MVRRQVLFFGRRLSVFDLSVFSLGIFDLDVFDLSVFGLGIFGFGGGFLEIGIGLFFELGDDFLGFILGHLGTDTVEEISESRVVLVTNEVLDNGFATFGGTCADIRKALAGFEHFDKPTESANSVD